MGDFEALSRSGSVGEGRGSGRQGAGRVSTVAAGLSGIAQHSVAWLLFAAFGLAAFRDLNSGLLQLAAGIALAAAGLTAAGVLLGGWPRRVIWLGYMAAAVLAFVTLSAHGMYVSQRGELGETELRAIAQTNLAEATEYLWSLATPASLALLTASLALLLVTFPRGARNRASRPLSWTAAILALCAAAYTLATTGRDYFGPMGQYIARYRSEASQFQSLLDRRRSEPIVGASATSAGTVVVVIGESTARHHLGIYGYFRDTTPSLAALQPRLLAFDDVISAHSHTVPALMSALTSSGATGQEQFFDPGSVDIVSLASAAGLETWWLSNQNEFGIFDNPVTMIGKSADHVQFFSTTLGKSFQRTRADAEMLPAVRELLAAPAARGRLVVVHMFSTHWPYCADHIAGAPAFPEPLDASFAGRHEVPASADCYDKGVRYVDWFLSEIIRAAERSPAPAAVIYFSDHGEAPLLGTGHESSRHSSYHVEIPLLLAANDAFLAERPGLWAQAEANRSRPYSTARLFHSLASLLGIRHDSVRPEDDLFSDQLRARDRVALDGRIQYDRWSQGNDYRENTRAALGQTGLLRDRVWAHRVDSIGALLEAKQIFAGVELDVVYEDSCACFRVYHPPAPDTGLTLDAMLAAARDRPQLQLWLDWKNASSANLTGAVAALSQLDARYALKERTLLETGSEAVFPGIGAISAAGFRHGYYLPTERIREALARNDPEELAGIARQTGSILEAGSFAAVTFDWKLRPFVTRWLDDVVSRRNLGLYSWDMTINLAIDEDDVDEIRSHFAELSLSGLLISFPSVHRI